MKIEYIETDFEEVVKIDGKVYMCHRELYSGDWIKLIKENLGVEIIQSKE